MTVYEMLRYEFAARTRFSVKLTGLSVSDVGPSDVGVSDVGGEPGCTFCRGFYGPVAEGLSATSSSSPVWC